VFKNGLGNLTPLQQDILLQLSRGSLTLRELSEATGSSIGTVGKQISILSLRASRDYMERKGVTEPLVSKDKDSIPTKYSLSEAGKKMFEKENN